MGTAKLWVEDQLIKCEADKIYSFGIENDLKKHPNSGLKEALETHSSFIKQVELCDVLQRLFLTFSTLYIATGYENTEIEYPLDASAMTAARAMVKPDKLPTLDAKVRRFSQQCKTKVSKSGMVSSFSGGKDSLYVALREGTVPVHVAKLDNAAKKRELEASLEYCVAGSLSSSVVNAPVVVSFLNSVPVCWSANKYVFREAATAVLMTQIALDLGLSKVYLATYGRQEFKKAINALYEKKKIPVRIKTIAKKVNEEDVTVWLMKNHYEIFERTVSCLLDPRMHKIMRNRFEKKHPKFPLFDGQCGYCDKDVRINMYRLLHDNAVVSLSPEIVLPVVEDLLSKAIKGTYDCCTPGVNLTGRIRAKYGI